MPTPTPSADEPPIWAMRDGATTLLRVKAVPGASRNAIAGTLGDRLKIRVAAPPEGGKANQAILTLLARALCVNEASLAIMQGHGNPLKTIRVDAPWSCLAHAIQTMNTTNRA